MFNFTVSILMVYKKTNASFSKFVTLQTFSIYASSIEEATTEAEALLEAFRKENTSLNYVFYRLRFIQES